MSSNSAATDGWAQAGPSDMSKSFSGHSVPVSTGGRLPSSGSENGFSSLSRADSDVSDSAPLLTPTFDKNPQPRMGHAIGYLRKPDKEPPQQLLPRPPPIIDPKSSHQQHQYQSISDDEENEFGSPLDLGPSLMDEVFSELGNYDTLKLKTDTDKVKGDGGNDGIIDGINKFADKVSTTLTMSRKHKGKKAAVVKPIKAADEKTLENAIKMANALASKSMQDLDMFSASPPQISPITPNSPTKKFTFKFPSSNSRHPGGDDSNSNVESLITPTARDAYKALIEGKDNFDSKPEPVPLSKSSSASSTHRLSLPPTSSVFSHSKVSLMSQTLEKENNISEEISNPIPLPPKEGKSHVTTGKRHVRKNPLILTSGAAANMARRFENEDSSSAAASSANVRTKNTHHLTPGNDAFEQEIAYSIDALDDIPESKYTSPKTSLEHQLKDLEDNEGGEQSQGRGVESDEVRIMSKVLGGVSADKAGCVHALDMTDWNVHRAIKIVKLKAMVRKPGVKDNDMKVALINHEWDLTKAAGEING